METASATLVAGASAALRAFAPFDGIPGERLEALLMRCSMVFVRRGAVIEHPDIPALEQCVWVVRRGSVTATDAARTEAASTTDGEQLGVGAMFPACGLLGAAERFRVYSADDDCYLWRIDTAELARWRAEPAVMQWAAWQLYEDQLRLRRMTAELTRARQHADHALAMPARSVGAADVVCVPSSASIASVAALMVEKNIGSVIVGSVAAVEGIATQTDLIARGLARGAPQDTPIAQVMTPDPRMIEATASVLEAGLEMAEHGIRHLLLRGTEGPVLGIVSERDIFRAQQAGITNVFRPIDEARSLPELVAAAQRSRQFGERVFRQGMEVSQFTALMSSMNDRISRRVLDMLGTGRELAPFCWLAFGSEARDEQGFVTDQDNGIVFAPAAGRDLEAARQDLLEFARAGNAALDACGFSLCKGNIMASNPELCLTLGEWQAKFSDWIRTTTPKALLNATIFFDLRAVHGVVGLGEALTDHLLGDVKGNTIFLHHMTVNALAVAPPIGRFSGFATARGQDHGTIDLKTQGTRLFVDVGRIYGLAHGVRTANTVNRLRIAGQQTRRAPAAIGGDIAAFRFTQSLRLRRQLDALRDGGAANRINPHALDELQQRILRESLRQAGSLQERLALDFNP